MPQVISIDTVLADVKVILRSFDEAGLLNEGDMIRHADWVINRLGIGVMDENTLILEVEDSKVEVPEHFKHLDFIYKCDKCGQSGGNTVRYYYGHPTKFTIRDYSKKICYDKCCIKEEHEEIKREIYIEGKEVVDNFCNKQLLSISPMVPKNKLGESCKNLHCLSPNKFNLDDKFFYFNFETGNVYIKYKKAYVDEEGYPLIIDDPYIIKAIQDYIIYQSFLMIYYNSEVDVLQRMQKAEIEHKTSLSEALYNDKLPEYNNFVRYGKLRGKSLEIFNLKSQADAVRQQHKGDTIRH